MKIKTEIWNGHEIRFVENEQGEWWAVAADVMKALALTNPTMALRRVNPENYTLITIEGINNGINSELNIVNELGIYCLIFKSRKKEAIQFQEWVYEMLKALRQSSGLEGFQVFRMLDKEHQKEAMQHLNTGLNIASRVDYIKANQIANKAISTRHGYPKAVKKNTMPPDWLPERQSILDDTVSLMTLNDRFALGVSVSETIYRKYCKQA